MTKSLQNCPSWREDLSAYSPVVSLRAGVTVFLTQPGFTLLRLYRLSVSAKRWFFIGKFISWLSTWAITSVFGCYISRKAEIGAGLYLPHPVGIVIGDAAIVGKGVTIYQHVTLGRRHKEEPVYPYVEDGCILYAGAVVAGGVHLGAGATVGANAVVTINIPQGRIMRAPHSVLI